jgi:hypothetical protein
MVSIIAVIAALVGWAGLALQLWLLVDKLGLLQGLWRFVAFFTILTNIGAAMVATAVAIGRGSLLARPRAQLMAANSILMVGLVYSIALRALWNPTGLQGVADVALHDLAPLIWLLLWLFSPHPHFTWREVGWALLPPILYVIYAMARGSAEGWYAYWFLDPSRQTPREFLSSIALLVIGFGLMATLLVATGRVLATRYRTSIPAPR